MDERTERVLRDMRATETAVALTQVPNAIGEAVLALHDAGSAITAADLIAHLLAEVRALQPEQMHRKRNEAAAARLGWKTP